MPRPGPRRRSSDSQVQRYVDEALSLHDDTAGAAMWLAAYVANDAADSADGRPRSALVEAYRRVRAMADGELGNIMDTLGVFGALGTQDSRDD